MVFRDTCLQSPCPCRGSILRARVLFNGSITENHGSLRSQLTVQKITASPLLFRGDAADSQSEVPIGDWLWFTYLAIENLLDFSWSGW